jgi:hypothetical protein
MTMLERAIAAAASAVGANPEDLRWLATGARLREWQPGEWLFHESTPYDWTGIIEEGTSTSFAACTAMNTSSTPSARARWSPRAPSWATPRTSPAPAHAPGRGCG